MKKLFSLLFCVLLAVGTVVAKTKEMPEYTLEGAGTSSAQGTYLVKVAVMTKDKKIPESELIRAAIHGVLFKGYTNTAVRPARQVKPVAGSPASEAKNADYYKNFFDSESGAFKNYASTVAGSRSVMKSGKQYKVMLTVSVFKDQLRKDLEAAGVLEGLNSIF